MNYECEKCRCPMGENEVSCPICGYQKPQFSAQNNADAPPMLNMGQPNAPQNPYGTQQPVDSTREFGNKSALNFETNGAQQNAYNMPAQGYTQPQYQAMPLGQNQQYQQQPLQQQYQQPVQQPVQQPMQQPAQQPMQQPVQQPMQQPVQQPMQQPVQQPAQQPMQQPVQQPVEQPVQAQFQQAQSGQGQPGQQRPAQSQGRPPMQPGQQQPAPLRPVQERKPQNGAMPNTRPDMGLTGILELEVEEKTRTGVFGKIPNDIGENFGDDGDGAPWAQPKKPKTYKSIIITVLIFVGVAVLGVLAAVFVVSPLLDGSNGDGQNPYSEYLLGSWLSEEFTYTENSDQNKVEYITFNQDDTFTLKYLIPNDQDPNGYQTGSWEEESSISGTISVDSENKRLVLHYTQGENNYYYDRFFVTMEQDEMVLREYYDSSQTTFYDMKFQKVSGAAQAEATPAADDAA